MNEARTRKSEARLTNEKFYQICEHLKAEAVANDHKIPLTHTVLSQTVTDYLGYNVSRSSIDHAVKMLGLVTATTEKKTNRANGKTTGEGKIHPAVVGALTELHEEVRRLRSRCNWFQKTAENLAEHVNFDLGNDESHH